MTIKAVTFDLWDTMVEDETDEPKRAAKGLRSKPDERRHLMWSALNAVDPSEPIDLESVTLAYDTADAGFNLVWKELHINWTVEQRLRVVLNGLGRSLPREDFDRLVEDTGRMEVEIPPNAIAGIGEALADLSQRYKLAVVSDAIVTPGVGLKAILEAVASPSTFPPSPSRTRSAIPSLTAPCSTAPAPGWAWRLTRSSISATATKTT